MNNYFTFNHVLEIPAVIFGVLNVYLAAREKIWNFVCGFIMCAIYFVLDLNVHLYADMTLQVIFIVFQFYGFYQWRYGNKRHGQRQIGYAPRAMLGVAVVVAIVIALVYAFVLKTYTDSTLIPIDVGATALSIVAQWMLSKKWVETWWLWMVIDVDSVVMYMTTHLYFTAGLYLLLLVLAIMGLVIWRRRARNSFYESVL